MAKGTPGAGLTGVQRGQASPDRPALEPYWGKPAVRNLRGDDGNVGIIRSPVRAIALPDSTVIVVQGDGSFGFNCFDFETAVRFKLPMVIVVGNDASCGQIRLPQGQAPLDKVEFSSLANEKIAKAVADSGRTRWILAGMESHVCVYQTARDMVAQGMDVFVVYDAVISRAAINFEIGIRLVERAGGVRHLDRGGPL